MVEQSYKGGSMKNIRLTIYVFFSYIVLLSMYANAQSANSGIYEVQVDNVKYEINPIQGIADVLGGATWLKKLSIPSFVTSPTDGKKYSVRGIREKAFFSHDSLAVVNIAKEVQTIGISAFSDCISLKAVNTGARDINANAFANCGSLRDITILEGTQKIGESAFANCERITKISLPSEIQILGAGTFRGCKSLKSFSLGNGPSYLPEYMFAECDSFNSIVLPETITTIERSAFEGCSQLADFTLPTQLETIGNSAFKNCRSLTGIIFSTNIKSIQDNAFESSGLDIVNLSSCTSCTIGMWVFKDCTNLKNVALPDNIKEIPAGLFYGCTNLTEVSLPQSVTLIDGFAFSHCGLKAVYIPSSVKKVGADSFRGISEVTGCEGLEIIGAYAFSGNLTEFPFPSTLKTIGEQAFAHNQFTHIELPEGLTSIGNAAFVPYERPDADPSVMQNWEIGSRNNTIESVVIPSTVTYWGNYAFSGCNNLKSVKVNNAKVAIRSDFNTCPRLESLDLGDSITSLGGLNYCPRLTELAVPGSINGFNPNSFEGTNIQVFQFKQSKSTFDFEKGLGYIVFGSKIKYLYIDRPIDFRHTYMDGLRALVLGDNIHEMDLSDIKFLTNRSHLVSTVFGNNFAKRLDDGFPYFANNLLFKSVFPPEGWPVRLITGYMGKPNVWVPKESLAIYNETWGAWLDSVGGRSKKQLADDCVIIENLSVPSSFNVSPGETIDIPVTYLPEKASITDLVWVSLNQDIISYNPKCKFIANKPGVVDVYCIAADGSNIKSNLCTVTVADEIPQDGITITPNPVSLEKGEHIQLKVITEKDGSEVSDVNWQSSDESIAMVSNTGILLARNNGRATITATLKANSDISDSIEVIVGDGSGIEDILTDKNTYVKVFNLSGVLIYEGIYSETNLAPDYYIVVCDGKNIKVKAE